MDLLVSLIAALAMLAGYIALGHFLWWIFDAINGNEPQ